ncbi:hypothetical protein RHMOL_Rhmol06G0127000 [Rhododendron molle]|uniref:Uncharacterized protein n=1 Tax=Rhododendron molle TaxID=49168 RepID=A0ACC0NBH7_RHOML|nr:hypothetical protein RHMOL_Rhmol06G0127000 [Rhododendron molle]
MEARFSDLPAELKVRNPEDEASVNSVQPIFASTIFALRLREKAVSTSFTALAALSASTACLRRSCTRRSPSSTPSLSGAVLEVVDDGMVVGGQGKGGGTGEVGIGWGCDGGGGLGELMEEKVGMRGARHWPLMSHARPSSGDSPDNGMASYDKYWAQPGVGLGHLRSRVPFRLPETVTLRDNDECTWGVPAHAQNGYQIYSVMSQQRHLTRAGHMLVLGEQAKETL